MTNYLFVTKEMLTFAAEINKIENKMKSMILLNGIIIIRLQGVVGSD